MGCYCCLPGPPEAGPGLPKSWPLLVEVRRNQTEQHNRAATILFEKAARDLDLDKERLVGYRDAAIKKAEKEVPWLFFVIVTA